MGNEIIEELKKTNRLLYALLTVTVDRHLRETDLAKPRPRSVDRMLKDIGLNHVEIATLLGKSKQAVGQMLAAEDKAHIKPVKKDNEKDDEQKENKEVPTNG